MWWGDVSSKAHMWQRIRKPVLSAFIAYHVLALALWVSPGYHFRDVFLKLVSPYMYCFGLWQNWAVFAPDPKNWNTFMTAEITYKDGTQKLWEFPRMEKLGIWDRMRMERFRKWANDCVNDPNQSIVWPDTCRYIARLNNQPNNPPVAVAIIRNWRWIDPPPEISGKTMPAGVFHSPLYVGKISPEDLQ